MLKVTSFDVVHSDVGKAFFMPGGMLTNGKAYYFTSMVLLNSWRQWARTFSGPREAADVLGVVFVSMHQTCELLMKCIGLCLVPEFDPLAYRHDLVALLERNREVSLFAEILMSPDTVDLLSALTAAYIGVRYGEMHTDYDDSRASLFTDLAGRLINTAEESHRRGPPACYVPK